VFTPHQRSRLLDELVTAAEQDRRVTAGPAFRLLFGSANEQRPVRPRRRPG
jgi:hypothetical protein